MSTESSMAPWFLGEGYVVSAPVRCTSFPKDLREWIPERALAQLVDEQVGKIQAVEGAPVRDTRGELLLGILAYSYLTGTFQSDEIELAFSRSPEAARVHDLAFSFREPSTVLRGFRRSNRDALEKCLERVLGQVLVMNPNYPPRTTSFDPAEEADRRIACAIQADSYSMDL